jgi:hypothetical protein
MKNTKYNILSYNIISFNNNNNNNGLKFGLSVYNDFFKTHAIFIIKYEK